MGGHFFDLGIRSFLEHSLLLQELSLDGTHFLLVAKSFFLQLVLQLLNIILLFFLQQLRTVQKRSVFLENNLIGLRTLNGSSVFKSRLILESSLSFSNRIPLKPDKKEGNGLCDNNPLRGRMEVAIKQLHHVCSMYHIYQPPDMYSESEN